MLLQIHVNEMNEIIFLLYERGLASQESIIHFEEWIANDIGSHGFIKLY